MRLQVASSSPRSSRAWRVSLKALPLAMMPRRSFGPADVHAAGRHLEVGRDLDLHPLRVDHGRGAGFDDFLDRLHAGPDAAETAHGDGVDAQVQDVLHRGRKEHRQAAGLEDVVALVRGGGAFADVVVARHRNHAAKLGGARHVGVFEHVGAAVHPRPLAVPDAKHAVELIGARWRKAQLLRAPHRRGGQLLVHPRLEHDVLRLEVLFGLPQRLVVGAQRRAPVTADKARRVAPLARIALALQHGQLDQGLHPAHKGRAIVQAVFVVQRRGFEGFAQRVR